MEKDIKLIKKDKITILSECKGLSVKENKIYFKGKEKKELNEIINKILNSKIDDNIKYIEYEIYPISEIDFYLKYHYDFGILYQDKDLFFVKGISGNK